jgi:preprotein translocase subunit SecE
MSLGIYKRGQGYYTRMISAVAGGVIAALGCYALYGKLDALVFVNQNLKIVVQSLVPLAVFGGFAFLMYWLVNKPIIADFMISAEGELKKVSWSTRQEITASTLIVIAVMLIMAGCLLVVDVSLQYFFQAIHLIPGGGA